MSARRPATTARQMGAEGMQEGHRTAGVAPGATQGVPRARKYRNTPTTVNGIRFDSKRESERYESLVVQERRGEIRDLEAHPRFPLVIHEQDCGYYEADFAYVTSQGERVIEDVKSPSTAKLPVYRLKVRQVWALYGIRVREIL